MGAPREAQPSHYQLSYPLGSRKLGTGSGLSSGPGFPWEAEVSEENRPFPYSARPGPGWWRRDWTGRRRPGVASASAELGDPGRTLPSWASGFSC